MRVSISWVNFVFMYEKRRNCSKKLGMGVRGNDGGDKYN
jgi:hypothetical protein